MNFIIYSLAIASVLTGLFKYYTSLNKNKNKNQSNLKFILLFCISFIISFFTFINYKKLHISENVVEQVTNNLNTPQAPF